jgi:hypothetical protein
MFGYSGGPVLSSQLRFLYRKRKKLKLVFSNNLIRISDILLCVDVTGTAFKRQQQDYRSVPYVGCAHNDGLCCHSSVASVENNFMAGTGSPSVSCPVFVLV